jgi:hypothetical protein
MNYSINKIIETSLWFYFPDVESIEVEDCDLKKDFLYTCLNNAERIHRNYTLCCLKEKNLLDRGIVSYRFKS